MATKYSESIKENAIQMAGLIGSRKIAKLLDIPRSTIRYWINDNHKRQVNGWSRVNKYKYKERYKERNRAYAKEYYLKHKDESEFKIKNNMRSAKWRKTNINYLTNYQKNNKDKFKTYKAKYRARKKQNGGGFTEREWIDLKNAFANSCLLCGKTELEVQLVPDHIVPISFGGSSNINNIQPLCKRCNSIKSNRENFIDVINL